MSGAARRLSRAIQFPTVSYWDAGAEPAAFGAFHEFLRDTYPLIHSAFTVETVCGHSLLYFLEGNSNLKPILLMAHMDVVSASERPGEKWTVPPFSGEERDGYIYGRGALDMKGQLISIFEAVETLLSKGFSPTRGIYIALGHDEETQETGNRAIAELLYSRRVELEYVFDEGGAFINASHIGVKRPLVLFGTGEKGYADITITVRAEGGHASIPPAKSPWSTIGRALLRLKGHPLKSRLTAPIWDMIRSLAPYMRFPLNIMARNLKLFGFVFRLLLSKQPFTNALIRTTLTPTTGEGSLQQNMLPQSVCINLNARILHGDSPEIISSYLKRLCKGAEIEILHYCPPSDISSGSLAPIRKIIQSVFPDYAAAPYIMPGSTDSKHYHRLCDKVILINPFPSMLRDHPRIHAADERISIESLEKGIEFFTVLLESLGGL